MQDPVVGRLLLYNSSCLHFYSHNLSTFYSLVNLVMDPLLIFATPLGVVGAAVATAFAETLSGAVYLKLLLRRKLANVRQIFRPPAFKSLMPLILGGASMLGRQVVLNFGFVCAARRAQSMDPTGVSAAAYGIVMQIYMVGIVMHVAMQGTAAALVPATLAKSGKDDARRVADRMFTWCTIVGVLLGMTQFLAIPWLVPVFSTLPAVQEAVRAPALIASALHLVNGPVFAGEGVMLGLGCYRDLMLMTAAGIGIMVGGLASPMGQKLNGILLSFLAFSSFQAVAAVVHYLKVGPLAVHKMRKEKSL
jgi:Na+-driven multidrug efflux pump